MTNNHWPAALESPLRAAEGIFVGLVLSALLTIAVLCVIFGVLSR